MVPSSPVRATIPNGKGVSLRFGPGGYPPCWSLDFLAFNIFGTGRRA